MARTSERRTRNQHALQHRTPDGIHDAMDTGDHARELAEKYQPIVDDCKVISLAIARISARRGKTTKLAAKLKSKYKLLRLLIHQDIIQKEFDNNEFNLEQLFRYLDGFYEKHLAAEDARKLKLEISGADGGPIEAKMALNPEDRAYLREWAKGKVKQEAE